MNYILNSITTRIIRLSKMSEDAAAKIESIAEGRLEIKHYGNKTYYYYINGDSKRLLSSNEITLIKDIAQKSYLEQIIKANNKELSILKKLEKSYPALTVEDIYDSLSTERKELVNPITPTNEQFRKSWQNEPYKQKPIGEGIPFYNTLRGERVRSKSEQLIADHLYANDIPYKYECPLKVGNKVIHPDFTILKLSERKEVYLEHLGKSDDDKYQDDNVPRINDYILNGFKLGDKLFLSFESSNTPLDTRVIDKMINEQFK